MKKSILIQENSFDKARNEIRKNKEKIIIFSSDQDELNRKILEKEQIDVLLINQKSRRDYQKQRNSGFNQVFAKLAKKNNVTIGINLDEIIESKNDKKREILARVGQNIKLCNKNRVKMKFIAQKKKNERDIYDLKALGLVLGMPTWMTSNLAMD